MSLARLKYQPSEEDLSIGKVLHEEDLESNSSTPSVVQGVSTTNEPPEKLASSNGNRGTSFERIQRESTEQKEKRFPLKRDFTQSSLTTKEANEDDWAKRNQGKSKVFNLVAKFSQDDKGSAQSSGPSSYKSDYGLGKKIGQIQQNKFH